VEHRGVTSEGIRTIAEYYERANEAAREYVLRYGGSGRGGGGRGGAGGGYQHGVGQLGYYHDTLGEGDREFDRLNDASSPADNARLPTIDNGGGSSSNGQSNGFLTGLEHVEVSGCDRVGSEALLRLVRACPRLRHLDCRDCAVGDGFVRALLGLPKLSAKDRVARGVSGQPVLEVDGVRVGKAMRLKLAQWEGKKEEKQNAGSGSVDSGAGSTGSGSAGGNSAGGGENAGGDNASGPPPSPPCGLSLHRLLLSARSLSVQAEAQLRQSR
jgi:hypothetical protein